MLLRRTVAAASYPVTLAEAKLHLRVDHGDDDTLIDGYIGAACEAIGEMAGRVLAVETWEMSVPTASGDLVLPMVPVQSVTGISYYDANGVDTSAVVADYYMFKDEDRAVLRPKPGHAWPSVQAREDALRVTFTVGYTTPPKNLIAAVLLLVGHLYATRHAAGDAIKEVPLGVETMVGLSRRGWVMA